MSCLRAVLLATVWAGASACAAQAQDGDAALRAGRYDEAVAFFTRRTESADAPADAFRKLVRALIETGRYAEAEAALKRAPLQHQKQLAVLRGELMLLLGRNAEAQSAFQEALTGRDHLQARVRLAILMYERGQREQALTEFDRFIDVYNEADGRLTADELIAVGMACRYLGTRDPQLFKDALKAFDEAAALEPARHEARVLAGLLFLEKYNSGEAKTSFAAVLEINPAHPDALLGLARALTFDAEAGALEPARKALQTNPNHVPARVFLARSYLVQESADSAEAQVRAALRVNPQSIEALAVLAAIQHARGDTNGFNATRDRVLTLNPLYASFFTTLADLSIQQRQYHKADGFAREAVRVDSSSWEAWGTLGINQLRLGDAAGARVSLERAFARDPYNVWVKNTLDLLDRLATFRAMETPRYTILANAGEAELLIPYAAELLDSALLRLEARYGYQPPLPIRLELFDRHADFSVRTVGLAGLGALGVSFGSVLAMNAPSARERGTFNWGSTLWHEVAHAFHLGMTGHRVPRWFTEGLAVLEERRARRGWGDDASAAFIEAARSGKLLDIDEINSGFVRPAYPEQVGVSYYQASLMIELIERDFGARAVPQMLRAYQRGSSTTDVLRSVLKLEPKQFDARFQQYLKQRFGPVLALSQEKFVEELTRGRDLFRERRYDDAVRQLEKTKQFFPDYTGEHTPYVYLAQIYRQQGDVRRAAAELQALTDIDESNYEALVDLAALQEQLNDSVGAAHSLERALYIYPFELELHARLADLYARMDNHAGAVRERRAVLALNPVDQTEARYQLALAHFQAGDIAGARREVLRALEAAPNYDKAQQLLLRINNR